MTIPENIYDELDPIVQGVASEFGRRYHSFGMDREDAAQAAWLWVFDHPNKLAQFLENDEYGARQLARTLRNELHDLGESVKAQHLGYSRDDLAYYSRTMIRELLPFLFDEDAWIHPERGEGERRSAGDPASGGNWLATLADVSRSFDLLAEEDRNLLIGFHRDGLRNKDMADLNAVSEQVMSYRHDAAVKRLQTLLGGPRPSPEHDAECEHEYRWGVGRRSMSNAAARAAQQNNYEES